MGRTDIGKDITRGSLWPDLNNKTLHVVVAVEEEVSRERGMRHVNGETILLRGKSIEVLKCYSCYR